MDLFASVNLSKNIMSSSYITINKLSIISLKKSLNVLIIFCKNTKFSVQYLVGIQ